MKSINKSIALIALLIFSGCTELDLNPLDSLNEATFFKSEDDAEYALSSIYECLPKSGLFLDIQYTEGITNNAYVYGDHGGPYGYVALSQHNASTGPQNNRWTNAYTLIQRANFLISNIGKSPIPESAKKRMVGEARFLRALSYFLLAETFGDVPLVLEKLSVDEYNTISRTDQATVLAQTLKDVDEALLDLPEPGDVPAAEYGRATKYAALTLKARILLYQKDYEGVIEVADQIIPHYTLYDNYLNMFLPEGEANSEVIFDINFIALEGYGGLMDYEFGGYPGIQPLQNFVDDYLTINGFPIEDDPAYDPLQPFDNRDPRLALTVSRDPLPIHRGAATLTGYYLRKYVNPTGDLSSVAMSAQNFIVFRLADVLLMKAEAQIELDQFDQSGWDGTIRLLRERVGFETASALDFPGGTQEDLRGILRYERRVELAFEGLWYSDIRRWGILTESLGEVTFDNRGSLALKNPDIYMQWPVPQSEINIDPNLLPQNNGY